MKLSLLIPFTLITLSLSVDLTGNAKAKNEDFPIENNLIVLTNKNFNKALRAYKNLVVIFYSPVCPFSAKLLPEFSKAAAILKSQNIVLAKVDAAEDTKLAEEYQVQAFPMVMAFGNKVHDIYYGKRKAQNIVSWALKKLVSSLNIIGKEEELEKFLDKNEVAVVYFGKDEKVSKEVENASKKIEEFPFSKVDDKKLFDKYEINKDNSVVLFKKDGNNLVKFILEDDIKVNNIEDFVYKYAYPKMFLEFNDEVSNLIFEKNQTALVYFNSINDKSYKTDKELLVKVADKLDYKMKVVIANTLLPYPQKLADFIGVKKSQLPDLRIIENQKKIVTYALNSDLTEEKVEKFVADYENKKLLPQIKSQLEFEYKGGVINLVGKNYKKNVIDNDKDVMVVLYAPWCGHCKELADIYEKVADKLKDNKDLVLAQIDATENDIDVEYDGFPTILFYPGDKKDKTPIEFTGERTVENLVKFISKHANTKIKTVNKPKNRDKDDKKEIKKDKVKADKKVEKKQVKKAKKDDDDKLTDL